MTEAVVAAEGLSKVYKVYSTPWDRLLEAVMRRRRHREFRALDGVSFALPRGEGLAVVGENGAGKSTLLRILAGISTPTSGRLAVRGKIASILELASGFHPEFTGRQNIVLNAAMLGLAEEDLRRRMPDIVAWSELGEFIDQPLKCYSTGMAMRLGFSIATQVDPDVLIIDEALSVGDGYFQKKCVDRLLQFIGAGGTLLFCSHAMYYVSAFCQRALWLRHGRAEALGPVLEVIGEYEAFLQQKASSRPEDPAGAPSILAEPASANDAIGPTDPTDPTDPNTASGSVLRALLSTPDTAGSAGSETFEAAHSTTAAPRSSRGNPARLIGARVVTPTAPGSAGSAGRSERPAAEPELASGDPWELEIEWQADERQRAFHVGVGINRRDGLEVCSFATHLDGRAPFQGSLAYLVRLSIPTLPLVKGDFMVYVFLLDDSGLHIYDQRLLQPAFKVASSRYAFGLFRVEHSWVAQEQLAPVPRRSAQA